MKKIVAIGGGEIKNLETIKIDKEIVKSTMKQTPKALFIPTASGEPKEYIEAFSKVYGEKLGCKVDVLKLIDENIKEYEIEYKIMDSDIIYVGGGDTKTMLEIWKEKKVDKALKKAWEKGTILSGLSAGSICWFESGHSDSMSFLDGREEWNYIKLNALGFIKAMHCPHYNEDNREEDFAKKIMKYDVIGIAIENNCAIEFKDNQYRVLTSEEGAKAYKVFKKDNSIMKEEIKKISTYRPLEELLTK